MDRQRRVRSGGISVAYTPTIATDLRTKAAMAGHSLRQKPHNGFASVGECSSDTTGLAFSLSSQFPPIGRLGGCLRRRVAPSRHLGLENERWTALLFLLLAGGGRHCRGRTLAPNEGVPPTCTKAVDGPGTDRSFIDRMLGARLRRAVAPGNAMAPRGAEPRAAFALRRRTSDAAPPARSAD